MSQVLGGHKAEPDSLDFPAGTQKWRVRGHITCDWQAWAGHHLPRPDTRSLSHTEKASHPTSLHEVEDRNLRGPALAQGPGNVHTGLVRAVAMAECQLLRPKQTPCGFQEKEETAWPGGRQHRWPGARDFGIENCLPWLKGAVGCASSQMRFQVGWEVRWLHPTRNVPGTWAAASRGGTSLK